MRCRRRDGLVEEEKRGQKCVEGVYDLWSTGTDKLRDNHTKTKSGQSDYSSFKIINSNNPRSAIIWIRRRHRSSLEIPPENSVFIMPPIWLEPLSKSTIFIYGENLPLMGAT